ncbi:Serine hydroxymethyltransferase [Phytophthora nicotianae]|uniref:Serine hydroxymethyltransferase n=1 Tax=Phytophthora nicotianae TaxID=4792 RepID=A0A0W8CGW4_PHYNI|nr:Serine hydroxymethyltransferase [Phytophthora nicotianae]
MVYTKSEDEFDQHATEFKHLACRENRDSLWNYFDKNWVACKDMLESFFGKLKADLDSSMSMRECLEATIRDQRPKEDEYVTRVVMPGTRRDLTYDDEMNQLFDMTSEWLADVFEPEYKFAGNPESAKMYNIDDEDLYVNFVRDGQVSRRQIQLDVYL